MRKTLLALSLLLGCDTAAPSDTPTMGNGEFCSNELRCSKVGATEVDGDVWVSCFTEFDTQCRLGPEPCEGVCYDMGDPEQECPADYDRCGETGFCRNLAFDEENCGGCGNVCPGEPSERICLDSVCCTVGPDGLPDCP